MLTLHNVAYIHPDKELLFNHLNLTVNARQKVALIGNNGTGKSTLLKIMAGALLPSHGAVHAQGVRYYLPQLAGQFNNWTVARALQAEAKLKALQQILNGQATNENLAALDDDWTVEDRCRDALEYWQLADLSLTQTLETLSGGQKTKLFLAGIQTAQPDIVLLDEPSNHLDRDSRALLYNHIENANQTLVVVSHDRKLLNLLDTVMELDEQGITTYGGNYNFYAEQKAIALDALQNDVESKERALRKAKETERGALERQQKLNARGKGKQEKAGMPKIMQNVMRNAAERSSGKLKGVHAERVEALSRELNELRGELPVVDQMKLDLDNSSLHTGKALTTASNINFGYSGQMLWQQPLSFKVLSGKRIAIKGANGSGKSTLLKIILNLLEPTIGTMERTKLNAVYIDQDYSLLDPKLTVYEQAQTFNSGALQEHDVRIRLNRFLFDTEALTKPCDALSGGERMRLALCCITIGQQAPDVIILDEPTNNLDIRNVEILTAAINSYKGTLLVVSHDDCFLEAAGVNDVILIE